MLCSEKQQNNYSECGVFENFPCNNALKPCNFCGRTFNPQSLERHEKVCEKTKKCIRRNKFNSFSQRAKDLGAIPVLNETKEEEKKSKKSKEEHESPSQVSRRKNSNSNILNNGSSKEKKVPPDYQQCPSCNRYFNQKAADRHIAWCTEQQVRLPKTPPNSEALQRLKARVKYRAPLPKQKMNNDSNIRLVKSAESIREQHVFRTTHSSPPIPTRNTKFLRQDVENSPRSSLKSCKEAEQNPPVSKSYSEEQISNINAGMQNKKCVKFKEIFPVYKKERNKNLDMLAALRLRLSVLETSDDFLDDSFSKSNENEMVGNPSKNCNFLASTEESRGIWTSDGEVQCSTSSSSNGSLPSIGCAGSSEQRIPRFCYNCGTKYPIISAKFCCECGAQRFVFSCNNNQLYTV